MLLSVHWKGREVSQSCAVGSLKRGLDSRFYEGDWVAAGHWKGERYGKFCSVGVI